MTSPDATTVTISGGGIKRPPQTVLRERPHGLRAGPTDSANEMGHEWVPTDQQARRGAQAGHMRRAIAGPRWQAAGPASSTAAEYSNEADQARPRPAVEDDRQAQPPLGATPAGCLQAGASCPLRAQSCPLRSPSSGSVSGGQNRACHQRDSREHGHTWLPQHLFQAGPAGANGGPVLPVHLACPKTQRGGASCGRPRAAPGARSLPCPWRRPVFPS
jgi:hypothetical protein